MLESLAASSEGLQTATVVASECHQPAPSDVQLGTTWPTDPQSPLNALRASHRGEHLDDVARTLGGRAS